jgi:internalin A
MQTPTTNEVMQAIAKLSSLTKLNLIETHVGDEGLSHILRLPNLEELLLQSDAVARDAHVPATEITDRGIESLITLPRLKTFILWDCNVTDRGIEGFAELRSLSKLSLFRTRVTEDGVRRLQLARPDLQIRLERREP